MMPLILAVPFVHLQKIDATAKEIATPAAAVATCLDGAGIDLSTGEHVDLSEV